MKDVTRNHKLNGEDVDFMVTHCCATSTQRAIDETLYSLDRHTEYLDKIKENVDYKKWFLGYYHDNKNVSEKEILVYEQITRVG